MRNYGGVTVGWAALHIVAPRESRLILTRAPLHLGDGVGRFLAGHVERGLSDPKASAAAFVTTAADRVGGISRAILDGSTPTLDASTDLARRLYAVTEKDARVSDGTLAVMDCTAEGDRRFVAMLKLDPSDQYSTVEGTNDQGDPVVQLEVRDGVLPSVRERVQKSAFIRPAGANYDMLLVDRQRRGTDVSDFFVRDFLQAESVLDAPARTKELYRALNLARNDIADKLDGGELARLTRYIDGAIVGERVRVDDLVDGLPVPDPALREPFRDRIAETLPDREFELDEDTVITLMRRRTFTGDNGLRVSARADAFGDMVDEQPPDGAGGEWVITVRTREWRAQ